MPNEPTNLRILILTYEYRPEKAVCPIGTTYQVAIQRENPQTWIFVYRELYMEHGKTGFERFVLNFIEEHSINVLMYAMDTDFEIGIDLLARLRKHCFVVLLSGDECHYFDVHIKCVAQAVDMALTHSYLYQANYEEMGIPARYAPPGFDPSVYFPMADVNKDIDVSFVGYVGNRQQRKEYLEYLQEHGIDVRAWGQGTANGFVSVENKREIYNRSKINLDFTGLTAHTILTLGEPIQQRMRHPKGRCVEIAMARTFVLSESAPGMEGYMSPGRELATFTDKEDLLDKVKYYLAHPEEREKIALAGYHRVIRDNEVHHVARGMLNSIRSVMADQDTINFNRKLEVFWTPEYKTNFSTYRIFLFLYFLKRGKYRFALEELIVFLRLKKINFAQAAYYLSKNFLFVDKVRRRVQSFFQVTH